MSQLLNRFVGLAEYDPFLGTAFSVPSNVTDEQSGTEGTSSEGGNAVGRPIKGTIRDMGKCVPHLGALVPTRNIE